MKDNLQLKARYYSQYLGANFIAPSIRGYQKLTLYAVNKVGAVFDDDLNEDQSAFPIEDCVLTLRTLASLTDEEAIQVAKIVEPLEKDYHTAYFGKMWANDILKFTSIPKALPVTEYLKSLSVALPCFDPSINQLIPIEQLVEWGWIALKK